MTFLLSILSFQNLSVLLHVILIFFLLHACMLKSYLTFCDPMDYSLLGSSLHGILQARILELVAMPSSRGLSWSRDWTHISYVSCIAGGFFTHRATWEALFSSTAWYYILRICCILPFHSTNLYFCCFTFFAIKIYDAISILIPVSWCMDAKISLEHTFIQLKMELLGRWNCATSHDKTKSPYYFPKW